MLIRFFEVPLLMQAYCSIQPPVPEPFEVMIGSIDLECLIMASYLPEHCSLLWCVVCNLPTIDSVLQVRLIIWRAKDVVAKDGVDQPTAQEVKEGADPAPTSSGCCSFCSCCGGSSGSSDVYVTAQFEGMDDKKETDVRNRAMRTVWR